jgi:hypothetical protein
LESSMPERFLGVSRLRDNAVAFVASLTVPVVIDTLHSLIGISRVHGFWYWIVFGGAGVLFFVVNYYHLSAYGSARRVAESLVVVLILTPAWVLVAALVAYAAHISVGFPE